MTATPNPAQHRNAGVDAIRGAAVLSVVLLHLNLQVPFSDTAAGRLLPESLYLVLFWSGFYGVAVFFVVSGYVITDSALKKWGTLPRLKTREFYAIRFARIMPLLGLLLLVLAILHALGVPHYVIDPERASLAQALFAALTFHINLLEIRVGYLPAAWDILWSLSIEETFYMALPLLCLVIRREWQFVAIVSCFLAISPWARVGLFPSNELGDRNHLAYVDGIAIGCCTALAAHRLHVPRSIVLWLFVVGSAMVIWIVCFRAQVFLLGLTGNGLYITVLSLGTALLLLGLHVRHLEGRATSHPSLGWLSAFGRLSYEVYLTHVFVVIACVAVFAGGPRTDVATYSLYAITIALSWVLAEIVARTVSNPANHWLRARLVGNDPDAVPRNRVV